MSELPGGTLVRRQFVALPVVAATLTLTACSSPTVAGNPTQISATTTASQSASDPLASADPCSLLSPSYVSSHGLTKEKLAPVAGARTCTWLASANLSNAGYSLSIRIYDNRGLNTINLPGDQVTNYPVGKHQGLLIKVLTGAGADGCVVVIGITTTSMVYVGGSDGAGSQDNACTEATQSAAAIEPNLPVVNG